MPGTAPAEQLDAEDQRQRDADLRVEQSQRAEDAERDRAVTADRDKAPRQGGDPAAGDHDPNSPGTADATTADAKDKGRKDADTSDGDAKDKGAEDADTKDGDAKDGKGKNGEAGDRKGGGKPGRQDGDTARPPDGPGAGGEAQPAGSGAKPVVGAPPAAGTAAAPPAAGQAPVTGAVAVSSAPVGVGGAEPVAAERVDAVANEPTGPLARHHLRDRPGTPERDEPNEGEQPLDVEPQTAGELEQPDEPGPPPEAQAAAAAPPGPEAYLPASDLDLSAVPTAERIELPLTGAPPPPPAVPSFPAPPEPAVPDAAGMAERTAAEERREEDRDRREGAAIDVAPGQIGSDAVEREPAQPPEAVATGPELEPANAASSTATAGVRTVDAGAGGTEPMDSEPADAGTRDAGREGADTRATDASGGEQADGEQAGAADQDPDGGASSGAPGALPADASMESGGGSCAPAPAPTTGADSGGGACGAAAPTAAEKPAPPAPPDLATQEPATALASAGQLPPVQMQQSLGGVDSAVNRSVGGERGELAAGPPAMARPVGAAQTQHGTPVAGAVAAARIAVLERVTPATLSKQRLPEGQKAPDGPAPTDRVPAPHIADDAQGTVSDDEIRTMQSAVDGVTTSDPALHQTVGPAPTVALSGDTDPALADEQKRRLDQQSGALRKTGREDAATPLGENRIYPDVRPETLKASVPAGASAAAPPKAVAASTAGPAAGGQDPDAISAVALQERGPQIQTGLGQGQAAMATGRQSKVQQSKQARTENQVQVEQAVRDGTDEQTAQRAQAKEEASGRRAEWRTEQDTLLKDNADKAEKEHGAKVRAVGGQKKTTDADIEHKRDEGNQNIVGERRKAEEKARQAREDKKKESDGWWGWVKSKVKAAFDALVSFVKGVFDLARKAISGIIDGFKKAITGLIDAARKLIVGFISALADALIAISGVLLAAFPGLRDKFRRYIENLRDAAINKVNQIADKLKKGIQKLLDLLAAGLTKLLDLYEKALLAAVELARSAVAKAIAFVDAAIKLVGEFGALVKDIAPDPMGWLKKLGTAARDGIRNHLWAATKIAVKEWFDNKVESILGLGKVLFNILVKGCMTMGQIARMAWESLIKALPMMIITIVIEKLISMIVPAAGAIMTIVQGLMAAWGTISRIIAVFSKFFTFLKAVKAGGVAAACLFAQAVASGVVALLEFITNFLLARLMSAAKGVASRLKGIAQRIMAALKRGAKAVRKGVGKVVNLAKRGAKAAAGAIKRGVRKVSSLTRRGLSKLANGARKGLKRIENGLRGLGRRLANSAPGRFLKRAGDKLKQKYQKAKQKYQDWKAKRAAAKKPPPSKEERLEKAIARIQPKVEPLLRRGVWTVVLRAVLYGLRLSYRLSALRIVGDAIFALEAILNPTVRFAKGVTIDRDRILRFIRELGAELRRSTQTERAANLSGFRKDQDPKTGVTGTTRTIRGGGAGVLAENIDTDGGPLATRRRERDTDLIEFVGGASAQNLTQSIPQTTQVQSTLRVGGNPRNFLFKVPDPKTGKLAEPTYARLKGWLHAMSPQRRREMADRMVTFLGDTTLSTGSVEDDRFVKATATWTVVGEGKRNPAAMVTHAMALDMVAQGKMNWKTAVQMMPMAKRRILRKDPKTGKTVSTAGPVAEADRLWSRLYGRRAMKSKSRIRSAEQLANREINLIQAWVRRMDIKFEENASREAHEERLMDAIRTRMNEIYRRADRVTETELEEVD
jgi:hypothetical protein